MQQSFPSTQAGTNFAMTDPIRSNLIRTVHHMDEDRGFMCRMMPNRRPSCVEEHPEYDNQWTLAMVTAFVIVLLQLHRLLVAVRLYHRGDTTGEYLARETVIAALAMLGIVVFVRNVRQCAMYEGILKLVATRELWKTKQETKAPSIDRGTVQYPYPMSLACFSSTASASRMCLGQTCRHKKN